MAGVDRRTGRPLAGWPHVEQSLRVIFETHVGARVMRRGFGSAVTAILGRNMTLAEILRFKTLVIVAIELWEPRFRVAFCHARLDNTTEDMKRGIFGMSVEGSHIPRGHLGDPTPETASRTATLLE